MERLLPAFAYLLPGVVAAAAALQAAIALSATFTQLKHKAAEQSLPVPPLAALYFASTVRVLFVTGVLFFGLAAGDAIAHLLGAGRTMARILGYGSGISLLVCSFGLLLQASVDRQLKLYSRRQRLLHALAGMAGTAAAAWGMILVTWQGGVWEG
ncbi:MAG: hypothetical protein H6841_02610 [Planctomycetes bacterium]|nr:hypothetical protein [Planctomycetota bacterium]